MEGTTIPHKMTYQATNGRTLTLYKQCSTDNLTPYEKQRIRKLEQTPITYDECLDITGDDPGDIIQEQTGVHPSRMFNETLKQYGYTYEEIEKYTPIPIETIKKIHSNSIYKKEAPPGIYFTYELEYVPPMKYKRTLQKLGVNVNSIPYWKNLDKLLETSK